MYATCRMCDEQPAHGLDGRCVRCKRAHKAPTRMRGRRARAWYWGAFLGGIVAGTPIGILLEGVHQCAARGGCWWSP